MEIIILKTKFLQDTATQRVVFKENYATRQINVEIIFRTWQICLRDHPWLESFKNFHFPAKHVILCDTAIFLNPTSLRKL